MDHVPVTGLEELQAHLQDLVKDPETPLNAKLFDEVELQLNETNTPRLIPQLLPVLVQILLSSYNQDPQLLASLSTKLLKPVPFTHALTLASEEALILALGSLAPSVNILALTVLHKAARNPSDTAILSIMQGVMLQFIQTWLSTPHVEVADKATQALGDLLEVDCDRRISADLATKLNGLQLSSQVPLGQGLLWRRIFHDQQIYQQIFELCSYRTRGTGEGQLDARQKSLAQGRLLSILPRLASLDFQTITHSKFPDIDAQYGDGEGEGLLYFAAVHMVVDERDMLLYSNLVNFILDFLGIMSMTNLSNSAVDYLTALMKRITADQTIYSSLESLLANPGTSPELLELLARLQIE